MFEGSDTLFEELEAQKNAIKEVVSIVEERSVFKRALRNQLTGKGCEDNEHVSRNLCSSLSHSIECGSEECLKLHIEQARNPKND